MINHLFFKEDEVALFSGIFPHNVFAVRDLTAKTVIWNPSVFDGVISTQSEIWKTGFPIDQSDFQARLDQTGYAKGTERLEDNDKEIYPL